MHGLSSPNYYYFLIFEKNLQFAKIFVKNCRLTFSVLSKTTKDESSNEELGVSVASSP